MKKHTSIILLTTATFALCANAAVTVSSTTPTVDGADIANLTWNNTNRTQKTFTDTTNHGQSFTTATNGGSGFELSSFSLQTDSTSYGTRNPLGQHGARTWNVRVVTMDGGGATSTVAHELGHTQPGGEWLSGDWYTFSLNTPVTLADNTAYGIDIQMASSDAWQNGIPYFRVNRPSTTTDGNYYNRVDGDPSTINENGDDLLFHANLTAVVAAIPEPTTTALLGLGGLALILRRRK